MFATRQSWQCFSLKLLVPGPGLIGPEFRHERDGVRVTRVALGVPRLKGRSRKEIGSDKIGNYAFAVAPRVGWPLQRPVSVLGCCSITATLRAEDASTALQGRVVCGS